jgi:hypothetical protein
MSPPGAPSALEAVIVSCDHFAGDADLCKQRLLSDYPGFPSSCLAMVGQPVYGPCPEEHRIASCVVGTRASFQYEGRGRHTAERIAVDVDVLQDACARDHGVFEPARR